jgi:acyl dehydratase
MPLDYDALMGTRVVARPSGFDEKDAMMYALGLGFGTDPTDEAELAYVYEGRALKTVPTMASVVTAVALRAKCGWDYSRVVLGEQRLDLYRPLPATAQLLTDSRVVAVFDEGPDKGALISVESEVRLARDDTAVFKLGSTLVARGDGGFGGLPGPVPQPQALPERDPDMTCDLDTRPDQALLFRLCGDRNPLHADPLQARRAGFDRPVLHGLCSYGVACRAILRTVCNYDHTLICGFDARFTSPVYPGDTLTTEMWQDRNVVAFRCLVRSRGVVVIDNGKCTLST